MAFSSFTHPWRTIQTNETNPLSSSSFMPRAAKFTTCPDLSDADAESYCNSDHEFSSTDAGDDICTTYVDFDDFASTSSSDEEVISDQKKSSPRFAEGAASACVYSVMMLLRMRAAVCGDDSDSSVHYGTRLLSELPPSPCKAKSTTKMRANPSISADAEESWRAAPESAGESWRAPSTMESWRQVLPASGADSWIAQQRKRNTDGSQGADENVFRTARSILNKLTVEKFDSLFEQLATCGISCSHHISMLMREVFEKATMQHHFIPMYAELCVKLEKDPRIAAAVEESDLPNNFHRLLLNQCQNVFEQLLDCSNMEADMDEEILFCRKQQALGNMKLIGQLLVHGMLSSDLFCACCEELLQKRNQCPEALESLVALVMVTGPKFDYRAWQYFQRLEKIFADMRMLTKDKSVLPRLRFLIRDVLDARDAGWPSSRSSGKVPTTLEEVRNAVDSPTKLNEVSSESCSSPKMEPACGKSCSEDSKADAKAGKKSVKFSFKDMTQEQSLIALVAAAPAPKPAFDVIAWRRALAAIFADLASDKNIPAAVQRVRLQQVPVECQAQQFVDMLTRIVEERRGAVRRCELAFLVGLTAAEDSAFDRKECLVGIGRFFNDVYAELCSEVHRLPAIMKSEFMPTVLNVFPTAELNKVVPNSMRK